MLFMERYTISIHLKKKTERNPTIAAVVYNIGEGSWDRILRHRGINREWILLRSMVASEVKHFRQCWRLHSFTYKSWEGLIEDEFLMTGDIEWCKRIHAASRYTKPFWETLSLDIINEYEAPKVIGEEGAHL
jgi:hypothetical protein